VKGCVVLDTKIKKMRERLNKHRQKIAELEAQAVEMEQEVENTEDELLGVLARSAANSMSGGMGEIFEILRGLLMKPETSAVSDDAVKFDNYKNYDENKESDSVDDTDEMEDTDESEI
jgi:hypothetical protein